MQTPQQKAHSWLTACGAGAVVYNLLSCTALQKTIRFPKYDSKLHSYNYTSRATHSQKQYIHVKVTHRQSSSLLHWALSTWVSGLLPGCSGLETDLPGKTAAKSDCLSLWGGEKWVGSTFYYLSNTAHLWTTTHKTLWACHVGFHPKLKQELNAFLQASFQPCTKNQISNQQAVVDADQPGDITDNPRRSKGQSRDAVWRSGLCLNHFPSPDIWYDC